MDTPNFPGQDQPQKPTRESILKSLENSPSPNLEGLNSFTLNPAVLPYEQVSKYDGTEYGYIYGIDNDDFYGNIEPWYKTVGKGAARLGLRTVSEVGKGAGFLLGLANPSTYSSFNINDIISNAADNGVSEIFKNFDNTINNDWLPTFQELADRDKSFISRAFTDGDFWMTDAVDAGAFFLSAMVPGMALSKLAVGARFAQLLSKTRFGASSVEGAIQGAGSVGNYLSKANSIAKTIDKFNAWGLSVAGEAMLEASTVKDKVYNDLSFDESGRIRVKEDGTPYTEAEKREIAGKAAGDTFVLNSALLAATNLLPVRWFSKFLGESGNPIVKGLNSPNKLYTDLTEEINNVLPTNKYLNNLNKLFSGKSGAFIKEGAKGILNEGFIEENAQLAISRITESYGQKGKTNIKTDIGAFIDQYASQTYKALTGQDQEAALSIGLGGIIGSAVGGVSGIRDFSNEKQIRDEAIKRYNDTKENWLKFSNIYKEEEKEITKEDGTKEVIKTIVLDENKKPVIDDEKIKNIVANYQSVNGMLNEADNLSDSLKKDLLKTTAFSEFVQAQIDAGLTDDIIKNLDSILTYTPEERAKIGFDLNSDASEQINFYKSIASDIIKQNKIIESDILLDGSKEDQARKRKLLSLAAEQSVYKHITNKLNNEINQLENDLIINDDTSSLTDTLVDQLNDLIRLKNSAQEVVNELKGSAPNSTEITYNENIVKEAEEKIEKVKKDNVEGLKTIKFDEKTQKYLYENNKRNQKQEQLSIIERKKKNKAGLINEIEIRGSKWAKYADTVNGKENFTKDLFLEFIEDLKKEQSETTPVEQKEVKVKFKDKDGKERETTFRVGDIIVGSPKEILKYVKSTRSSDIAYADTTIEILSVTDDTVTLLYDNIETITLPKDEAAQYLYDQGFKSLGRLSPIEKAEKRLRNISVQYRVIDRDKRGKLVYKDDKPVFKAVFGRIVLNDAKNAFLFTWVHPETGKRYYVDYNEKFVLNRRDISRFLDFEEGVRQEQIRIVSEKFNTQKRYLENLISEAETKLEETLSLQQANADDIILSEIEIEDLQKELNRTIAKLNNVSKIDKNLASEIEEKVNRISDLLAKKSQQLDTLIKERDNLNSIKNSLEEARELYFEGLIELDESGDPYLADESGNIYGELNAELQQQEVANRNRYSLDEVNKMITDTVNEINSLDDKISLLEKIIEDIKSILNRLYMFPAIQKVLEKLTKESDIPFALFKYRQTLTDPLEIKTVTSILHGFNKKNRNGYLSYFTEQFVSASARLNTLKEKQLELLEKLNTLEESKKIAEDVSSLEDRVNFLKFIQEGLLEQKEADRQKKLISRLMSISEQRDKELHSNFSADTDVFQDKELFEAGSGKLPVLAEGGLFTTTGKHFVDEEDTQINNESGNARFFKFSENVNLLEDDYKLIPVNKNNDTYGIVRADIYDNDIKLIVVKKVGNDYLPVDVNGEVLETPNADNIIYTSLRGNAELDKGSMAEAVAYVKKHFVYKGLEDKDIIKLITNFRNFKSKILNQISNNSIQPIEISGKTSGIPNILPPVTTDGLKLNTPIEGVLIEEDTQDFTSLKAPNGQKVSLEVSTIEQSAKFKNIKPGRVLIVREDGTIFRVFNREMNDKEKENFINVLKKYSILLYKSQSNTISQEEDLDLKDIIQYLQGISFFTDAETKKSGSANRFYLKDGNLIRGNVSIPFTESEIERNKEVLTYRLYNAVNNKLIKSNTPFYQIIIDDKGDIEKVEFQNYNQYLISNKDANGNPRRLGENIIYGNYLRPDSEINNVQSKSVNLIIKDEFNIENEFTKPVEVIKNTSETGYKGKFKLSGTAVAQSNLAADPVQENPVEMIGDTVVSQSEAQSYRGKFKLKVTAATDSSVVPENAIPIANTSTEEIQSNIFNVEEQTETFDEQDVANFMALVNSGKLSSGSAEGHYREALSDNPDVIEDIAKFKRWLSKRLNIPVEVTNNLIDNVAWGSFKNGIITLYEKAEVGTGFHEAFEAVWNSYLTNEQQISLLNEFRSRTGEFYNPFTKETKPYSEASFYDVREMLAEEFRTIMLTEEENINEKTFIGLIGEFFKNIWNAIKAVLGFTSKDELTIQELFDKINKGDYKYSKSVRDLTDINTYSLSIPQTTQEFTRKFNEGVVAVFFQKLYSTNKSNNIDSLLSEDSDNKGLFISLFNETMNEIKELLINPIIPYAQSYAKHKNVPLSDELMDTVTRVYFKTNRLAKFIPHALDPNNRNIIYTNLKANLSKFGLKFTKITDEDVIEKLRENGELKDGIVESIYIDPRTRTTVNYRMLIGSLTNDVYSDTAISSNNPLGIITQKNELGLPIPVDYEKTSLLLLNELNGITSKYTDGEFKSSIQQMFDRLDFKYKRGDKYKNGYVWIERLKKRLKLNEPFETLSDDDIRIRIGFQKSLINKQNIPVRWILGPNGYIYPTNPIEYTTEDKIKETWSSNVLADLQPLDKKNKNKLLGVADDGNIVIDTQSTIFNGGTQKPYFKMKASQLSLVNVLSLLEELGIKFSVPFEELKKHNDKIKNAFDSIRLKIMDGSVRTMNDLYYSNIVKTPVTTLIGIESNSLPEDNLLMHMTAEGKPQYSITSPSLMSNVINSFNTTDNLKDFIESNPQLGYVDGNVIKFHPYQQGSYLLKPGGILYDNNGNKRPNAKLEYKLISGISDNESKGISTDSLLYPDRVMLELNSILDNTYYTIINSDKSTEFGIKLEKPFVSSRLATAGVNSNDFNAVLQMFKDNLLDEINAAIYERDNPSYIKNYSSSAKSLSYHFLPILKRNPKLIDYYNDYIKDTKSRITPEFFVNKPEVTAVFKEYITEHIDNTLQGLIDLDIITKNEDDTYSTLAISHDIIKKSLAEGGFAIVDPLRMRINEVKALVTFFTLNKRFSVIEQHKFVYGHPSLFKDLAKRANGANSTKEAIVDDDKVIAWMDQNRKRFDGKVRSKDKIQTFKNISFEEFKNVSLYYKTTAKGIYDSFIAEGMSVEEAEKRTGASFDSNGNFIKFIVKMNKNTPEFTGEIKAYIEQSEADGQAWIMPDMYRDMMFLSGKFTKEQESQWEYEIAYEIVARANKPTSDPAYRKPLSDKELSDAQDILSKGNPQVIISTLKPQYFGYAKNSKLTHTVFLKHSVQPKFYRHIEGTEFEKLYLAAQKNQIDIIGFDSGHKVGNMIDKNGKIIPMYDSLGFMNVEQTKSGYNLPSNLPILELYTKFYGIQQEVPAIAKNKGPRGTQVTKIILSNFLGEDEVSYSSKEAEDLITQYNHTLTSMIKLGKEELLEELGLEKISNNYYHVKDANKIISLLRTELTRRELPTNLVDALVVDEVNNTVKYKFDTFANRDKIDEILNSIIDSRVISEKMPGKPVVQVASTGWEKLGKGRNLLYKIDNPDGSFSYKEASEITEDERVSSSSVYTSSDLAFYSLENGKIKSMECYVPWYFDISPEVFGLKLENGVYKIPEGFDERLLKSLGFRIPTQGMNSIESITIKGFLPLEMGDMIVVPSEIVAKAGSDFDIDKLNLYLPNYNIVDDKADFYSDDFRNFAVTELQKIIRSEDDTTETFYTPKQAEYILDVFKDNYLDIFNAHYTIKGKEEKNNINGTSLEEMIPDSNTRAIAADLKRVMSKYHKQLDGKKKIVYIEHSEDTKEGLQNKYLTTMLDLFSLPENFRQLLIPNGSSRLESIAKELNVLKNKNTNLETGAGLIELLPMAETRERYITGKKMVGIAALQITSHVLSQVSKLVLSGNYNAKSLYYLFNDKGKKPIVLRLNHKKINDKFYLGLKKDARGNWISELLSEATTGFVDAAKNPFVFDLNLTFNTAGTWFYLQKLGVPVEDIAYLFSQPAVESYLKNADKNNSYFRDINNKKEQNVVLFLNTVEPYLNIAEPALKNSYSQYISNLTQILNLESQNAYANSRRIIALRKENKAIRQKVASFIEQNRKDNIYPTSKLVSNIKKGFNPKNVLTKEEALDQILLLSDFLEYREQSRFLTQFIRSIGYDTNKTKTGKAAELQKVNWNKMEKENFIENPTNILDKTFLGEMKKQKEDIPVLLSNFFVTLSPKVKPLFNKIFEKLSDSSLFLSREATDDILNKYQNFVLNYIVQQTPFKKGNSITKLSNYYMTLMNGQNSIARMLKIMKDSNNPNITENLFIKELIPVLAYDVKEVDNIKLFRNRMDNYKINSLVESLNDLKSYADNVQLTPLSEFIDNLIILSIIQSGFQPSFLNFTKVLPVSLYTELVNNIINNYLNNDSIQFSPDVVWREFHQNFYMDNDIVPKAKFVTKSQFSPNISISLDFDGKNEYVKLYKIKPNTNYSSSEISELIKKGQGRKVFEVVLYERFEIGEDHKGEMVGHFKPINKKGDGRKMSETSIDGRNSVLDRNNNIDDQGNLIATRVPDEFIDDITIEEEPKPVVTTPTEYKGSFRLKNINTSTDVEVINRYSDLDLKQNPNKIYVFGDNVQRTGTGGQAQIRNNPNAFGIATKLKPSTTDDAYMTDNSLESNKKIIDSDIAKIKAQNKTVVFPKDGLGTGLAKLKEKAPKTFTYLNQRLLEEFGFNNETGEIQKKTSTNTISSNNLPDITPSC